MTTTTTTVAVAVPSGTVKTKLLPSTKLGDSKECSKDNNSNSNSNNNTKTKNNTHLNDQKTPTTTTSTTLTTIVMPRITNDIEKVTSLRRSANKVVDTDSKNKNADCDGNSKTIVTATEQNVIPAIVTTMTTTTGVTNMANDIIHCTNNKTFKNSTENLSTNVNMTKAITITTTGTTILTTTITTGTTRTMQTDEDFNIRFVNLVRIHKCLYDKQVPAYRNRDNQEKAWLQISQETKESVIHCKERWRNLRACLSRYIKQQNSTDPQHKPYYLAEHMAFLLPFLKSTLNSSDGNGSLVPLFQYSRQPQHISQQQQQCNGLINNGINSTIMENEDEETLDAFDPIIAANLNIQNNNNNHYHQHYQQNNYNRSIHSPTLSDTASANSLQPFIPDVQLSELRTPDNIQQMATYDNDNVNNTNNNNNNSHVNNNNYNHQLHHNNYNNHNGHLRIDSYGHRTPEPKRIKTECQTNETTTTTASILNNASHMHLYAAEQADMEFFRSILPDIASLTPQQKRKLKIGILELIDDVVERYPADGLNSHAIQITTNSNNNNNNNNCNTSMNNNAAIVSISSHNVTVPPIFTVATLGSVSAATAPAGPTTTIAATSITTAVLPLSSQHSTQHNSINEYHNTHHQYKYQHQNPHRHHQRK